MCVNKSNYANSLFVTPKQRNPLYDLLYDLLCKVCSHISRQTVWRQNIQMRPYHVSGLAQGKSSLCDLFPIQCLSYCNTKMRF